MHPPHGELTTPKMGKVLKGKVKKREGKVPAGLLNDGTSSRSFFVNNVIVNPKNLTTPKATTMPPIKPTTTTTTNTTNPPARFARTQRNELDSS